MQAQSKYKLCQFREDVEDPNDYKPGGYHPIELHDRLNHRYEIIHKLGYGSYSTVWLARDHDEGKNVAIKISTADNDRPTESMVLATLSRSSDDAPDLSITARLLLPAVLDYFTIHGPNGEHHCLVMPPASGSVGDSCDPTLSTGMFRLPVARALAGQIAEAVALVHARGVVHAGKSPDSSHARPADSPSRSPSRQHPLPTSRRVAKFVS